MSDALDVGSLDRTQRDALRRLVLSLADSKRLMGIRYSDWLLGSPSIETGIATSSMAQDEWGHARLLYSMLKDLDIDPVPIEHDRASEEYASVAPLDEEMPDWAALVAAICLVDGAMTTMLESFAEGSFEPARGRVPKMLAEEEFHASLGSAWFKRLAGAGGDAHRLLGEATRAMIPDLLAWVGADDGPARAMVEAGVIGDADGRVVAFRDRVRALTALVDVDVDAVVPSEDWDPARARSPGHPSEEAVERARGDRNRALFVE
ncbi:MAG: phenylacetate-CoA oxygenase subunit PaaI [Gemmatimonadota bacterium]|nr:phenylacetate-CoA oxygenase subunit PaaI [Gemmatimonadota bacterium]